jgi:hypothetical protein
MNSTDIPKTSKILLENLGGNIYTIMKDNEKTEPNYCAINQIDILGDEIINSNFLNDDFYTKFYIISLSVIGIYVFSRIIIKSQYF